MPLIRYALMLFLAAGLAGIHPCRAGTDTTRYNIVIPGMDPVVTSDSSTCIIPFSRAGNLILIKAKADTAEGNFVLDTGAPGLVLNLTYFRKYTAMTEPDGDNGGITGTADGGGHVMVDSLAFGGIHCYHIEADR